MSHGDSHWRLNLSTSPERFSQRARAFKDRHMPKTSDRPLGILERVNYVVRRWEDPCQAPFTVYLETLWPALLKAVLSLLWSNFYQVIRGYMRPSRMLRSSRHGRRGQRGRRVSILGRWGRVFGADPGTAIGKRLPGASAFHGRYVTNGVKHLWVIDTFIQRLMWYWLVVEVATEFAYHWTTLIYQSRQCQQIGQHVILASGKDITWTSLSGWSSIAAWTIEKQRGEASWNVTAGSVPAGDFTVVCAINSRQEGETPNTLAVRMEITPTNAPPHTSEADSADDQSGTEGVFVSTSIRGPASFRIECRVSHGFRVGTDVLVSINGRSPQMKV